MQLFGAPKWLRNIFSLDWVERSEKSRMNIVRLHTLIASLIAVFLYFGISGERASGSPPSYAWHEIHNAAGAGDLKKVKEILDSNPNEIEAKLGVNHMGSNAEVDVTPLSVAAAAGKADVVKLLLERGARINCGLDAYPSAYPLHEAARHGHLDMARFLLDHGAQVNAAGTVDGTTALHLACQGGHAEMAEFLLEKGARVNATDSDYLYSLKCAGVTAVHIATAAGNTKLVNLLMEHGADVNAQVKTSLICGVIDRYQPT